MLAINTDYIIDHGCPEPKLQMIAQAGFTHIHWCHQWCSDFFYSPSEIDQIACWLKQYNLSLLDLHSSAGVEKCWFAQQEYQRLAGLDLVKNRIEMTAALGGDVIIMHGNPPSDGSTENKLLFTQLHKSLDTLQPFADDHKVRIAIENGYFPDIKRLLAHYPAEFLGLCYDCGHGNLPQHEGGQGMEQFDSIKDRLISVHLHDNNGIDDQHKLPFTGSIDWQRLAGIIAKSAYQDRALSFEVSMRCMDIETEQQFLAQAFKAATKFSNMVDQLK